MNPDLLFFFALSIGVSVLSLIIFYIIIQDDLKTNVVTNDLSEAIYVKDRGDGIKDLVVRGNLQMIGSNDNSETFKTGRIVFNHLEDDIHGEKPKAMIARRCNLYNGATGDEHDEGIFITVKNAIQRGENGEEATTTAMGWVDFYNNVNNVYSSAYYNVSALGAYADQSVVDSEGYDMNFS